MRKKLVVLLFVLIGSLIAGCKTRERTIEVTRIVTEKEVVIETVVETETVIETVVQTKLDSTPRLAVISAFGAELELLLGETDVEEEYILLGHTFTTGKLAGNDVVLLLSGVSMENATLNAQATIDHFNVTHIVFSGIAGGVNPDLHIGDVTVPEQWGMYQKQLFARETDEGWGLGWHDATYGNFGMMFPQDVDVFSVAGTADERESKFWFEVDSEMLAFAEGVAAAVDLAQCTEGDDAVCLDYDPVIKVGGNGVSGPTFVDNAAYRTWTWDTFGADALDMETAAVALVAHVNDVPYIAFRSLSDLAGGGEGENLIGVFFQLAADNSANLVLSFLEAWATGEIPEKVEAEPTEPLYPVSVVLQWLPNVEFAGLWWGMEKGWFHAAGIEVTKYLPWAPGVDPTTLVAAGSYTFGFNDGAAVVIGRSMGMPIKCVYASFQVSPFAFATLADSELTKMEDLKGKIVGYQSHELYLLEEMLAYVGFTLDDIIAVEVGFDPTPLITGDVDAFLVYISNEPTSLRLAGIETNLIKAEDYGFHFYGGCLFTTDEMIEEHPEVVEAFVEVFKEGWIYAVEHPKETVDMTVEVYFPPESADTVARQHHYDHQMGEMLVFVEQVQGDLPLGEIGTMTEARWQEGVHILYDFGQIDNMPEVNALYTNDFVD